MNRVYVSVEGQTEETFVRELLRRHLWERNVDLQPVVITTHRVKQGNKFKGGVLSYDQARNEVHLLLKDKKATAVTTLYDLYHLPRDFPGQSTRPKKDGRAKALHLEKAFQDDIGSRHFWPHLQVHEFEAFLFVDPARTASLFAGMADLAEQLQKIRKKFPTPEDINDNPATAPSKRILSIYPRYEKPLYGTMVALEVGLDAIRAECPHFDEWVTWLESLG